MERMERAFSNRAVRRPTFTFWSLFINYSGEEQGSRVARKHIIWFLSYLPMKIELNKDTMDKIRTPHEQLDFVKFESESLKIKNERTRFTNKLLC